jgi:cell division protein FtsQ
MKKWLQILIAVLLSTLVVVILYFANIQNDDEYVAYPEINIIVNGENAFLTKKELYKRLHQKNLVYKGQKVNSLNITKIERYIQNMTEVLDVKVFKNIGESWNIEVEIRRPIARIFNKYGQSFYLDELGHVINTSFLYTARVVVVNGDIRDKNLHMTVDKLLSKSEYSLSYCLDDIYRISHYISNHSFFKYQIVQIYREVSGKYVLIPRVGKQKIIFGTANSDLEVKTKFRKLANFYKDGIPYEGWNTYDVFDLSFDNQVVCSKNIEQNI